MSRQWTSAALTAWVITGSACDDDFAGPALDADRCFPVSGDTTPRSYGPRPDHEVQGTSLQGGDAPIHTNQGTSLQGGDAPIHTAQGTSLQGGDAPIHTSQGTALQSTGSHRLHSYRGIADLDGVRLRIADTGAALALADGEPVAEGFASPEALVGVDLEATTVAGDVFVATIVGVTRAGGVAHVALAAGGGPVCEVGDEGLLVEGRWDPTGAWIDDPGALTYACASGVITKCVTWGYAPWDVGAEIHQACTRMARADYCGEGEPWTLDGTEIDVFDELGIRARTDDADFTFEAAWGPNGATCVNRTRYDIRDRDGDAVVPDCVSELPSCTALRDAAAAEASLGNSSTHAPIAACE